MVVSFVDVLLMFVDVCVILSCPPRSFLNRKLEMTFPGEILSFPGETMSFPGERLFSPGKGQFLRGKCDNFYLVKVIFLCLSKNYQRDPKSADFDSPALVTGLLSRFPDVAAPSRRPARSRPLRLAHRQSTANHQIMELLRD